MQTTPLFAVFSGHSRGKKGFCHDKQHWKGVFCVHCGELLFFTEGRRARLMALAAMKGLKVKSLKYYIVNKLSVLLVLMSF
jgi:hypothetical protein